MDEIQLGNDLVREGYRLSCQCVPSEAVTVQVAPALEERAFQILGAGPGVVGMGRVTLDSGIRKQVVKVSLPREEHHQVSDLEQLAAALGVTPTDVGLAVLQGLPAALRDDPAGVTVTTFAPPGGRGSERVVAVERGDTAGMKFGLAVDIGTTSVVSTLIELDSGEQLASVSSLNPQAVFGGDLMSRIAFAQFDPGNLRKLHTRIIGLLNRHIEEACRQSGVLAKWIYKVVVVGNTCMHHLLLGIDPSFVGLAPYAPVMRHALVLPARELFLKVAPEARVCLLPLVAGFVGAMPSPSPGRPASTRAPRFASPWTSGPTARSSWARATASGRARRRQARRSRARRSATGCAAPWAPSTVSPWTTTSTCTRSARPTLSGSAARGSSISSPGCSTRA